LLGRFIFGVFVTMEREGNGVDLVNGCARKGKFEGTDW